MFVVSLVSWSLFRFDCGGFLVQCMKIILFSFHCGLSLDVQKRNFFDLTKGLKVSTLLCSEKAETEAWFRFAGGIATLINQPALTEVN